jgi:hypothetical protein
MSPFPRPHTGSALGAGALLCYRVTNNKVFIKSCIDAPGAGPGHGPTASASAKCQHCQAQARGPGPARGSCSCRLCQCSNEGAHTPAQEACWEWVGRVRSCGLQFVAIVTRVQVHGDFLVHVGYHLRDGQAQEGAPQSHGLMLKSRPACLQCPRSHATTSPLPVSLVRAPGTRGRGTHHLSLDTKTDLGARV